MPYAFYLCDTVYEEKRIHCEIWSITSGLYVNALKE